MMMEKKIIYAVVLLSLILPVSIALADDGNEDEYGIWWINDYSHNPSYSSVNYTDDEADAFDDKMDAEGFERQYYQYDDAATEDQFERSAKGGVDYSYVDAVDFFYFCGHGSVQKIVFNEDNDGDGYHEKYVYASDHSSNEVEWGNTDLEWVFLQSCSSLRSSYKTEWNDAFEGLHGICGFDTDTHCKEGGPLGNWTAYYLTDGGLDIHDAWREATEKTIKYDRDGAIYRAKIRIDTTYYDYGDEDIDSFLPDYGDTGVHFVSYLYSEWDCEWEP
jgi:hypothetical protein